MKDACWLLCLFSTLFCNLKIKIYNPNLDEGMLLLILRINIMNAVIKKKINIKTSGNFCGVSGYLERHRRLIEWWKLLLSGIVIVTLEYFSQLVSQSNVLYLPVNSIITCYKWTYWATISYFQCLFRIKIWMSCRLN